MLTSRQDWVFSTEKTVLCYHTCTVPTGVAHFVQQSSAHSCALAAYLRYNYILYNSYSLHTLRPYARGGGEGWRANLESKSDSTSLSKSPKFLDSASTLPPPHTLGVYILCTTRTKIAKRAIGVYLCNTRVQNIHILFFHYSDSNELLS